ncbi:hypothetical protein K2X33_05985 [bacterium]|nr:hypothetical protein [bacterium]
MPILAFTRLICWLLAFAACAALFSALPLDLRRASVVTGAPAFENFDIRSLVYFEYLLLLVPPFLGWAMSEWLSKRKWFPKESPLPSLEFGNPMGRLWWFAPLLVGFLAIQTPPPALGNPRDFFHEGERMIPALLLLEGKIPWKDFVVIHGIWEDVLQGLPGFWIWGEKSLWANLASTSVFWRPFGLTLTALLFQFWLPRNAVWLACCLVSLLTYPRIFGGIFFTQRFLLSPACLLACLYFLKNPTWKRATLFSFLGVLSVFFGSEFLFFDLAFAAIVVLADLQAWEFRRTPRFVGTALGWLALGFAALWAIGALGPFIHFHLDSAQDHIFSGGLPIQGVDPTWLWWRRLCVAVTLWVGLSAWYRRKPLSAEWLTALAAGIFTAFFFIKFLGRADQPHFLTSWAPSLPLLFFLIGYGLSRADQAIHTRVPHSWAKRFAYPLSTLVLVGMLYSHGRSFLETLLNNAEEKFGKPGTLITLGNDPGPIVTTEEVHGNVNQWRAYFEKSPEPFFDFTNQPLFFFHFIGAKPVNPFYYTIVANNPRLQDQLIEALQSQPPKHIALASTKPSFFAWDGIDNFIRHAQVSQYLLRHYEPREWIGTTLRAARVEGYPKAEAWRKLIGPLKDCDFGYLSHYQSQLPLPADLKKTALPLSESGRGWEIEIPGTLAENGGQIELQWEVAQPESVRLLFEGLGFQGIRAKTLGGAGETLRILVDSCPHWYARESNRITIASDGKLGTATWLTR